MVIKMFFKLVPKFILKSSDVPLRLKSLFQERSCSRGSITNPLCYTPHLSENNNKNEEAQKEMEDHKIKKEMAAKLAVLPLALLSNERPR